jgi:hypothetical protein
MAGAALVAAALIGTAAFTGTTSAGADARVRVVHASPDAPAVDVYVNGEPVLGDVAFKGASDYLTVPAGDYNFQVFAAGADPASDAPVIDAEATLETGMDYTVVAVGRLAEIQPAVFATERTAPAPGKASVQVIHASPDAPAVDVAVAAGPVLFSNLAFPDAAGPAEVDAGTYDLEVRPAGSTDVALPLNGVTLEEGRGYTVVAVGLLEGEPQLEALTLVSDTPAEAAAPTDDALATGQASPQAETGALPDTGVGPTDGGPANMTLMVALLATGAAAVIGGTALALNGRRVR